MGFTYHLDTASLGVVTVNDDEYQVLLTAARSGLASVYGESTRTLACKRARALTGAGLFRYAEGAQGGWSRGTWLAYLTCNGWNALWRHSGDRHVEGCGALWGPNGRCTGCRQRRRLDMPAYHRMLETLTADELTREMRTCALWCIEHGYIRITEATTTKVCPHTGTSIHDGGLDRIPFVTPPDRPLPPHVGELR